MNEENTKGTLVEPALRALGWDVENIDEVRREFKRKKSDKPVDYALLVLRAPRLFVEVKALGQNLAEWRWASQIMGYASVAGVEWVVLTDGDEYRLYNSHATVAVEEKLFRTVRISDEGLQAKETLQLLSKEQLRENRIEVLWNAYFVDRQVRTVVENMFSEDPDASLIRLVGKKIPNLSRKEIKASLARAQVDVDFPVEPEPREAVQKAATGTGKQTRAATKRLDVSLADLIRAGLLKPPMRLEKTYKGRHLTAEVDRNGRVRFANKEYNSLSVSAGVARASIIGTPTGRKYPQTNGWTFWQFRDEDDQSRPVDVLRQRYLEKQASVVPLDTKRRAR